MFVKREIFYFKKLSILKEMKSSLVKIPGKRPKNIITTPSIPACSN